MRPSIRVSTEIGLRLDFSFNPRIGILGDCLAMDGEELYKYLKSKQGTGKKFPMYILRDVPRQTNDLVCTVQGDQNVITEASEAYIGFVEPSGKGSKNPNSYGGYVWILKRRIEILKKVAMYVLEQNKAHFYEGKVLVAFTQQECATAIQEDNSAVSRSIKGKSIEINGKVYPLKYFFTTRPHHPGSVRKWIQTQIEGEDPENPLSDRQLASLFNQEYHSLGSSIQARTMRKYRAEAGYESSYKRKGK